MPVFKDSNVFCPNCASEMELHTVSTYYWCNACRTGIPSTSEDYIDWHKEHHIDPLGRFV